jgi:hypothetical protein
VAFLGWGAHAQLNLLARQEPGESGWPIPELARDTGLSMTALASGWVLGNRQQLAAARLIAAHRGSAVIPKAGLCECGGTLMRTSRVLALLAAGAILTFAVRVHLGFLDLPVTGLITMATAIAALAVIIGASALTRAVARAARTGGELIDMMSSLGPEPGVRVPLDELLECEPDRPVGAGQTQANREGRRS